MEKTRPTAALADLAISLAGAARVSTCATLRPAARQTRTRRRHAACPSLDGLGPVGGADHAPGEYLRPRLDRAAHDPARGAPARRQPAAVDAPGHLMSARETIHDFIVIGAGAAGEAAAFEARRLGAERRRRRTRAGRGILPVLGVHAVEIAAARGRRSTRVGGDYPWRRASNFQRDCMISREKIASSRMTPVTSRDLEKAGATRACAASARIVGPGAVERRRRGGGARVEVKRPQPDPGGRLQTRPCRRSARTSTDIQPWTNREATSTRRLPKSAARPRRRPNGRRARPGLRAVRGPGHDRPPREPREPRAIIQATQRRSGQGAREGRRQAPPRRQA